MSRRITFTCPDAVNSKLAALMANKDLDQSAIIKMAINEMHQREIAARAPKPTFRQQKQLEAHQAKLNRILRYKGSDEPLEYSYGEGEYAVNATTAEGTLEWGVGHHMCDVTLQMYRAFVEAHERTGQPPPEWARIRHYA